MRLRQAKDRFTASFRETTQEDGAGPRAWGSLGTGGAEGLSSRSEPQPCLDSSPTRAGAPELLTHQTGRRGSLSDPGSRKGLPVVLLPVQSEPKKPSTLEPILGRPAAPQGTRQAQRPQSSQKTEAPLWLGAGGGQTWKLSDSLCEQTPPESATLKVRLRLCARPVSADLDKVSAAPRPCRDGTMVLRQPHRAPPTAKGSRMEARGQSQSHHSPLHLTPQALPSQGPRRPQARQTPRAPSCRKVRLWRFLELSSKEGLHAARAGCVRHSPRPLCPLGPDREHYRPPRCGRATHGRRPRAWLF